MVRVSFFLPLHDVLALTNGLFLQVDGKEVLKFAAAYGFRNIQVCVLGVQLVNPLTGTTQILNKVGFSSDITANLALLCTIISEFYKQDKHSKRETEVLESCTVLLITEAQSPLFTLAALIKFIAAGKNK